MFCVSTRKQKVSGSTHHYNLQTNVIISTYIDIRFCIKANIITYLFTVETRFFEHGIIRIPWSLQLFLRSELFEIPDFSNQFSEFSYIYVYKSSELVCYLYGKNITKLNKVEMEKGKEKLQELNVYKPPGPDNLHPRVFKEIASVLVNPLFMIFNLNIKHSKIPSAWKLASITAIYKNKGSKHSAENYRPISLTSIACKIMESFIRDSMLNYLKANDILSNEQFGFLQGRSTVLQLLKVVDKWTEIMDKGGVIDVINCDFQKAFDTVPHKRLLRDTDSLRYN